ncbi:MAG TPA: two-component system response regulator, partial [Alphaproteobacteria bacterium]|nr:two-component system response regulator [Alphaproteobacteria bacterium]
MNMQVTIPTTDNTVIVVDDEMSLTNRMGRALERLGFAVELAGSVSEATRIIDEKKPRFAVFDMRLPDGNGLELVKRLHT